MNENPYQAPAVTEVAAETDAERTRRKYLNHEASVKGVGTLYLLGGVLGGVTLLFGLVPIFVAAKTGGSSEEIGKIVGEAAVAIISGGVIGGLQLFAGLGLRKLTKTGRVLGAVVAGISLIFIPVGTILGAAILYLLLGAQGKVVFSPGYREVIAQTPHIRYRTSKWLWIILLLVVGLIIVGGAALFFMASSSR